MTDGRTLVSGQPLITPKVDFWTISGVRTILLIWVANKNNYLGQTFDMATHYRTKRRILDLNLNQ